MDPNFLAVALFMTFCLVMRLTVFAPLQNRHAILLLLSDGAKTAEEIQHRISLLPEEVAEILGGMEQRLQLARVPQNPPLFTITPTGCQDLRFYARVNRD